MKVLNFGSLNYDYVYDVDHMVRAGETLASSGMSVFCGGKGLNQSIALARAGAGVYHAGLLGTDGQKLLDACSENGVNTEYIRQLEEKSGHTIIQVDKDAQNCILLYGGTNRRMTKEYIDSVLNNFGKDDILLLQNEINLLDYVIDRAYEKGMTIVLNPSPFDEALHACDMCKISVFLLNEIEGEQMTGQTEPEKILCGMQEKYPEARIVLTLGGDGVAYRYHDTTHRQGIFRVRTVDTTAAGDTFTGYFIAGLLNGMDIPDILRRCAKASAIAVSRKGAVSSIPTAEEVEAWNFGI